MNADKVEGDILTRILAFSVRPCVGRLPEYIFYLTSKAHVQRKRNQNARFSFYAVGL